MVNSVKLDHKLFWNSTLEISGAWSKATRKTPISYDLGQAYLTPPSNVFVLPSEVAKLLTDRGGTVYPYEMSRVANALPDSSFFISSLTSSDNTFIEDEWTAQLDWEIPLNVNDQISGSIKLGSKYRLKNREYDASNRGTGLTGGDAPQMRASIIALNPDIPFSGLSKYVGQNLPTYNILGDYDEQILDKQFEHRGFVDPSYVRQIILSMDDSNWEPSVTANMDRRNLPDDYSGNESVFASYAMSELNLTKYLLLVGGVRYEKIKTYYKSFGVTEFGTADFQIREFEDDMATRINSYLLPMINTKIMPVKWINVRLAYTQSIARPRYYSYMPRYRLTRLKALENIGNPALRPALSHNFDAYVSFINSSETRLPTGIFTIGAFYKRIEDYEFVKTYKNVADSVNKNHPYYPQIISDNREEDINVPINNPYDAYSRGIEIDYQTSFWYLPKPFNGLVLNTNYTYTETEQTQIAQKVNRVTDPQRPWITIRTEVFDTLTKQELFNQPKHTFNASLGYDYKGFSARVAYFRRSRSFIGFNNSAGGGDLPENNRYGAVKEVWDLSLTQKIPWVDGLQFFFNMSNITETYNIYEYIEKSEGGKYPLQQEYFGRTTIIGFRYKI
jgi:TonB-dependent receptor